MEVLGWFCKLKKLEFKTQSNIILNLVSFWHINILDKVVTSFLENMDSVVSSFYNPSPGFSSFQHHQDKKKYWYAEGWPDNVHFYSMVVQQEDLEEWSSKQPDFH